MDGVKQVNETTLDIFLTNNDLEAIANGYEVKITVGKQIDFDRIVIRQHPMADLTNPLINFDKKIISQADLTARDIARGMFEIGVK